MAAFAVTENTRVYIRGDKRTVFYRITKTGVLFFSWICLGLFNEVVGPTLSDLKARVSSDYEQISRVLSARSAGLFLGSLAGGVLHDRFTRRRDLLLAASLLVAALTIASAPWCSELWLLGVLFHLMGYGHALLTTGGNPTLAFLWADKAAGPYNFLHSGFGVGAALGPLISQPFLSPEVDPDANLTTSAPPHADPDDVAHNATASIRTSTSRIEYPYLIVGLLSAVGAAAFLGFYASRSGQPAAFVPGEETELGRIFQPGRCAGGSRAFGSQMLALIFAYYLVVIGGERTYGKFLFAYAVDGEPALAKERASWLGALYWISFTVARLAAFAASRWLPARALLLIQISGTLLSAVGLNALRGEPVAFWLLTASFGFFRSPLFPTGLGWANRYVDVSSMTIACVNLGSAAGGMTMQWLAGYLFEYHGPPTFLYVLAANSALLCLVFAAMDVVARRRGERFHSPGGATDGVGVQLSRFTAKRDAPLRQNAAEQQSGDVTGYTNAVDE